MFYNDQVIRRFDDFDLYLALQNYVTNTNNYLNFCVVCYSFRNILRSYVIR